MSGILTVRAPAATTALRDLFQEIGLGARAVFGGELDVVHVAARQFDRGDGFVEHLLLRLLELVLQVDVAGGDEGVDARPLGVRQRLRRRVPRRACSSAPARPPAPRGTRG